MLGNVLNWPGWEAVPVDHKAIGGSETYYSGCQRKMGGQAAAGAQVQGVGVQGTLSLAFSREAGFVRP
jgi:hypothetical protein